MGRFEAAVACFRDRPFLRDAQRTMVQRRTMRSFFLMAVLVLISGCSQGSGSADGQGESKITKPQRTDDIREFDAGAGKEIVPLDAKVTDPITGPLAILKQQQIHLPALQIQQAMDLFNASEGRYPTSHDEFMTQIIRANNLTLPKLPDDQQYQYDMAGHQLLIVRIKDEKIGK